MPAARTIGSRIRAFREERDVDLETLAQNTGLSAEFLSKLEHDAIYPSIGPLQKVARALGVRLGTFLDDQFTRDPIISRLTAARRTKPCTPGAFPGPAMCTMPWARARTIGTWSLFT